MSWSRDKGGPRGYHHGNLKEALIRAALELIARKGPAGFTFAEAARSAGVSPAAPYRHYRDRDELLIDVARLGFDKFTQALARGWGEGRPDPFTAFERLGRAYLEFAHTEPAYYSAMFEAGVPLGVDSELRAAGERAFAVLRSAADELIAGMPSERRPPALMIALHVWAPVHDGAAQSSRVPAAILKNPNPENPMPGRLFDRPGMVVRRPKCPKRLIDPAAHCRDRPVAAIARTTRTSTRQTADWPSPRPSGQ